MQRIGIEEIADMVERHKDDHKSAHPVDARQSGTRRRPKKRGLSDRSRRHLVHHWDQPAFSLAHIN